MKRVVEQQKSCHAELGELRIKLLEPFDIYRKYDPFRLNCFECSCVHVGAPRVLLCSWVCFGGYWLCMVAPRCSWGTLRRSWGAPWCSWVLLSASRVLYVNWVRAEYQLKTGIFVAFQVQVLVSNTSPPPPSLKARRCQDLRAMP